jgi:hypothetical protein
MPKALMVTFTNPAKTDQEAEFNEWYGGTHIPQFLASVPGITSAVRYRAAEHQLTPEPPAHRYLTIYEIEADDLAAVLGALGARVADGSIGMSDLLELQPPPVTLMFEAMQP